MDIWLVIQFCEIFGDFVVLREPGEILSELEMDLGGNALRFCVFSFLLGLDGRHGRRDRRCAPRQQWRGGINASEIYSMKHSSLNVSTAVFLLDSNVPFIIFYLSLTTFVCACVVCLRFNTHIRILCTPFRIRVSLKY